MVDVQPVRRFVRCLLNLARHRVADNLLPAGPAVHQVCLSSQFFRQTSLHPVKVTVDDIVNILPADILNTFHALVNRLIYELVSGSIKSEFTSQVNAPDR